MHLRLIVPPAVTASVVERLVEDPTATNVVLQAGAARRPAGDLISCEVTREAVSGTLGWLRELGVFTDGGVSLSEADALSDNAEEAERAAPGAPDDAVVWDMALSQARSEVRGSWSFYAFMTLATVIASVAVVTDSAILVVGAMVVGPEFAVVAALALGLALWRSSLARRALELLVKGFGTAILIAIVLALLARALGWIDTGTVTAARPLTGFIWRPDRWSAVVALLAGCAGVLSQTSGKSNALVGVFISVTTIPAAGDLALSIALWAPHQIVGSAGQLLLNLACMTVAGLLTLWAQRALWHRVHQRAVPAR
ncbi:MAG TPA: DUF389 domain-containing protein [Jatrophihabitans sp.]|nr:DUF389 domain-containing protein [Jatrophihabitans sp.]